MSVTLNHITFDCADAARVADFWSSVLDEPVDDGASPDFATITSRTSASWMFVKVPEGNAPQVRVGKPAGQRIHVDLRGRRRPARTRRSNGSSHSAPSSCGTASKTEPAG